MKKTVAALALGAILIPAAVIAGSHYGEHRGEYRAERMAEHLQLTEQQRSDLKKIFDEQREQRRAMRDQMRNENQARISQVLTPEQQAKWQEYREERREAGCDRKGRHGKRYHHDRYEYERGHRYEPDED